MTCENCYHYKACMHLIDVSMEELLICDNFKNKNNVIEIPADIGKTVYFVTNACDGCHYYSDLLKPEELEDMFSTCRKCDKMEVVERKLDYDLLLEFGKAVFFTREEAEKALKERDTK